MAPTVFPLISLLFFSLSGHAYTDFETNCTIPVKSDNVNFADSPNVRGTMDIIWSCFTVLILCTWNVQHLSVPAHDKIAEKGKGVWADVKWNLIETWTKTKWMLLMIIMPEYLFGKAVCEHCAASWSVKQLAQPLARDGENIANKDDRPLPWSLVHGYFANMRGFVLRFEAQTVPSDLKPLRGSDEGKDITHVSVNPETSYLSQPEPDTIEREKRHWDKYCKEHGISNEWISTSQPDSSGEYPDIRPVAPLFTKQGSLKPLALFSKGKKSDKTPNNAQDVKIVEKARALENDAQDQTKATNPRSPTTPLTIDVNITPAPLASDVDITKQYPRFTGQWALGTHQLVHAYERGILKVPTRVPVHDIQDKSKGDGMAKAITVMQITWLVIQIIARATQDLAITLLEITVLAFATTGIAIYFVIWDKPQTVHTPIYIDADRPLTRQDVIALAARAPKSSLFVKEFWLYGVSVRTMQDNIFPYSQGIEIKTPMWLHRLFTRGPGGAASRKKAKPSSSSTTLQQAQPAAAGTTTTADPKPPVMLINPILLGLGLGGAIFGVVHCAAWNFSFPSDTEQLLWQISCMVIVMFPILSAVIYWARQHMAERSETADADWTNKVLVIVCPPIVLTYLLARLFLVVEVFRSLAYPDPTVFSTVDWTQVLPHLG